MSVVAGVRRCAVRWTLAVVLVASMHPVPGAAKKPGLEPQAPPVSGRELFLREWQPGRPVGRGGDGLGPMYNAVSCVACHNQGGVGGAGPNEKNVTLLSLAGDARRAKGRIPPAELHPGFADARTVTLHRYGVAADYEPWRQTMLDIDVPHDLSPEKAEERRAEIERHLAAQAPVFRVRHGVHHLQVSQRNTPALFGAGTIDRIPSEDIRRLALEQSRKRGGVSGRVAPIAARPVELLDEVFRPAGAVDLGEIEKFAEAVFATARAEPVGRFGWRGQIETLEEFVLSACANELGLQTPRHKQAADPLDPWPHDDEDMTAEEREALVAYVAGIPPPRQIVPGDMDSSVAVFEGRELFDAVGCADCHVADVGPAFGVYSDLLLHDLGPRLADPAPAAPASTVTPAGGFSYFGATSVPVTVESNTRQEWRTPPLWGVRDSAPYLHDGRAATLAEAIDLHGGEAVASVKRYGRLSGEERAKLLAFLNTLAAPE